ncbi:heavy metal-responsive transcriptional regulator [Pseudonocardia sp. C8]|uniref:Heavy metal-responsive transcriptional regulator n=2 Tax=Saccharopolyspora cebuensis TaxID=418759 RepID=A0ABV4CQQ9_9PSEU|nr:heavy metal-responsive transcriptional regulator [Pseudonocardia sp. C8]
MDMTVGTAARAAGVSAKAVRLWESKGLLPPAERTEAGYRLFTEDDLGVLRFIRQAKALGLQLTEIKDILDLQREGSVPCARVTELLDARITEIDRTVADLRQLRRSLATVRRSARDSQRRGEHAVVCRLIENHTDSEDQQGAAGEKTPDAD